MKVIQPEQVGAYLRAAVEHNVLPMFCLELTSGLRRGKLLALLCIPQQAIDLLIQEHSLHPDNPYMFPSPVTRTTYHPDMVGRIHKKLLKESGIENVRFYDLRHTFDTVALQSGIDIKTLSHMLRHFSSGFTLETYTHVTAKMQQEATEKMGNFMQMTL